MLSLSSLAVEKSGRVLGAFSALYFHHYDLHPLALFKHYRPLGVVSAAIYELDEAVERGAGLEECQCGLENIAAYIKASSGHIPAIYAHLTDAYSYYRFEINCVCGDQLYSLEDLKLALSWRSFDFRVLHLVLLQILGSTPDERLLAWFHVFEMLMEIQDDKLSEDEDRRKRTMNTFCLLSRLQLPVDVDLCAELRTQLAEAFSALDSKAQIACRNTEAIYKLLCKADSRHV